MLALMVDAQIALDSIRPLSRVARVLDRRSEDHDGRDLHPADRAKLETLRDGDTQCPLKLAAIAVAQLPR